jgi:hypothetical protein
MLQQIINILLKNMRLTTIYLFPFFIYGSSLLHTTRHSPMQRSVSPDHGLLDREPIRGVQLLGFGFACSGTVAALYRGSPVQGRG